jgi:hypothetical protein
MNTEFNLQVYPLNSSELEEIVGGNFIRNVAASCVAYVICEFVNGFVDGFNGK